MRVLFFCGDEAWSGSARAFATAGRLLAAREYSVTFACRPQSAVEQRVGEDGLTVVNVSDQGTWMDESRRLRRALTEHFVEVVFVHSEREHLIASAALRMAVRGAVIRRVPLGASATAGRAERAAARLAASGFLFADPRELQLAPPPHRPLDAVVAPLGVSVERHAEVRPVARGTMGVGPDGQLIVCVTDEASRSRVATALRTLALLAAHHPGLRLAITGTGADHEDLRMHAAALGITGLVSFLGERDDQIAVLRAADVGWVAADGDDAAFAFLDFMALRVPVVTDRGPLAQAYVPDQIAGVLLSPRDANAAAAAVAQLLADAERRQAMGRAGQARVAREFSEDVMGAGFQAAADAARDRSRWAR